MLNPYGGDKVMEGIKPSKAKRLDMINGSLADKIILFAIPIAVSSILQQLFNSVDIAVVGHFASSGAQAAVGCNAVIINLVINAFVAFAVSPNIIIANYIGKGETDRISSAVHTSITIGAVSGVFIMMLGNLFARYILTRMDTPHDILEQAILYLRLYFLGMPFIILYNIGSAILRSVGDTKRPLYSLMASGVVNVVLNLLLVVVFKLDVAGVAIATVIANFINASLVIYFLLKESEPIKLSIKKLSISKTEIAKILKLGIPAAVQGSVFSISNMFIQMGINGFGSAAVAGATISLNYELFNYFVIVAFNQTVVTFIGQNLGAQKYDRCKSSIVICFIYTIVLTILLSALFIIKKEFFIGLFTHDQEIAKYAAIRMYYIVGLAFIMCIYEILGSAIRGFGYSMTPAVLITVGICVFRIAWVVFVCPHYNTYEALVSIYPISWAATSVAVLIAYFIIARRVFRRNLNYDVA